MFVSDLRHFLDLPDDVPGPARRMAEHLGFVVRAATAGEAGAPWVSALACRRRPGRRPCRGHIAVFRAHLPAPLQWQCRVCGDNGVISGWEESPFDLRLPRSRPADEQKHETLLTDELSATLRDVQLVDTDGERLVFGMRSSPDGIVLTASAEDLDDLVGFVAAEANHETNRRRQKRLDEASAVLSDVLNAMASGGNSPLGGAASTRATGTGGDTEGLNGRWRILEMDLWHREALDLVAPAFIEFQPDGTGSFGFIAVTGRMDRRSQEIDRGAVEYSWEGTDEGHHVSGRGWAALQDDASLHGHIYFHLGDDSGFRAEPWRH
jgi:hypothetical protein